MAVHSRAFLVCSFLLAGACATPSHKLENEDPDPDAGRHGEDDAAMPSGEDAAMLPEGPEAGLSGLGDPGPPRNTALPGFEQMSTAEFFRRMQGTYTINCVATNGLASPGAAWLLLAENGSMRLSSLDGETWLESIVEKVDEDSIVGGADNVQNRHWIVRREEGPNMMRVSFSPRGEIEVTGWTDNAEARCLWEPPSGMPLTGKEVPEVLAALAEQDIVLRDPHYRVSFSREGTMTLFSHELGGDYETRILSRSWLGGRLASPFKKGAGDILRWRFDDKTREIQLNYPDVKLFFDGSKRLIKIKVLQLGQELWTQPPHECGAPLGSQVVMPWQYGDAKTLASDGVTLLVGTDERVLRTDIATGQTTVSTSYQSATSTWAAADGMIVAFGQPSLHIPFSGEPTPLEVPTIDGEVLAWDAARSSLLVLNRSTLWRAGVGEAEAQQVFSLETDYENFSPYEWRLAPSGAIFVSPRYERYPHVLFRINGDWTKTQLPLVASPAGAFDTEASVRVLGATTKHLFYEVHGSYPGFSDDRGIYRTSHDGGETERILERPLTNTYAFATDNALYVRAAEGVWRFDDQRNVQQLVSDILCGGDGSGGDRSAIFTHGGFVYSTTFVPTRREVQVWRIKE